MASRLVDVTMEFIRSFFARMILWRLGCYTSILVLFWFWYSSCFDVKCWFHTFPNRCSHISMGVLILLDHRDFHVNPFQPVCLLFKLFHTDVVEKSDDCLFHSSQVVFISPPSLPFLYGAGILNQISILFMWYFFILFLQCSYPVIYREDAQELQVHHSFVL